MLPRRRSIRLAVAGGLFAASLLLPILWKAMGGDPARASGIVVELVQFASAGCMLAAFWISAGVALPRLSEFLQSLVATVVYLVTGLVVWWILSLVTDVPLQAQYAFDLVVLWPMEFALRLSTGFA